MYKYKIYQTHTPLEDTKTTLEEAVLVGILNITSILTYKTYINLS